MNKATKRDGEEQSEGSHIQARQPDSLKININDKYFRNLTSLNIIKFYNYTPLVAGRLQLAICFEYNIQECEKLKMVSRNTR